jgi:transcriptional regulator with XRE-family HTH domain
VPAAGAADLSARFLRVVGDELRRARRGRGWRRADLRDQLGGALSVQAIATYEQGTRACTIARLLELTRGLGVSMPELLERALERMPDIRPGLVVDLRALAGCRHAALSPARRWARAHLYHAGNRETTLVRLDRTAIDALAELCGMEPGELTHRLSTLELPS